MRDVRVAPGLFDYEPRTLEVHGNAVSCVDSGSGPPVVLVHGNPTWSFAFRDIIAGLVDEHRVIAPDHVGMGRSARPDPGAYPYTLSRRIADLDSIIDQLVPTGPVDLVLHDWGGPIGCGWATTHPDRVGRILLLNTAAFPPPLGMGLPWALRLARSPAGGVLVRRFGTFNLAALAVGARRRLPKPVVEGYLAPYRTARDRRAIYEFVLDIPVRESDPAWAPLAAMASRLHVLRDHAVTICWGMKDPVFTAPVLDEWRRRLPSAQVVRFPSAGHFVFEDAPTPVVKIARDLFAPADAP